MTRTSSIVALVVSLACGTLAPAGPAGAQEVVAEVKTWAGQAFRLAEPSIEAYYTIIPTPKDPNTGQPVPGQGGAGVETTPGVFSGVRMTGAIESLTTFFDKGPAPLQGHRRVEHLTLRRGETDVRIPVERIAALAFTRQRVAKSSLPPYVQAQHMRQTVTALLTDGSRIEADYVNLGTLILRGETPQGRVDVPWTDIEVVRFQR